jgi:hypothetical protein
VTDPPTPDPTATPPPTDGELLRLTLVLLTDCTDPPDAVRVDPPDRAADDAWLSVRVPARDVAHAAGLPLDVTVGDGHVTLTLWDVRGPRHGPAPAFPDRPDEPAGRLARLDGLRAELAVLLADLPPGYATVEAARAVDALDDLAAALTDAALGPAGSSPEAYP